MVDIIYKDDTTNLDPGTTIQDTLINHSDVPQKVMIVVFPYLLDNHGNSRCPGIPDTAYVWVAPELKVIVDSISTFIGGRNISCYNRSDGFIYLKPRGGITAFTGYDDSDLKYAWTNGKTLRDIAGLRAGTYSITISDKLKCVDDSTFILTQPQVLTNAIQIIEPLKSCIIGDGIIGGIANGGSASYKYEWVTLPFLYVYNASENGDTLYSVTDGPYELKVTDMNGCVSFAESTIQQPTALQLMSMIWPRYDSTEIKCHGDFNGGIYTINLTGENATFNLSCAQTGFNITYTTNHLRDSILNLPAGTYNGLYTNAYGCKITETIVLREPEILRVANSTLKEYPGGFNVSCFGSSNGQITLDSIKGGHDESPYSFNWQSLSGGTITNPYSRNQNGLKAGTYRVTVTDAFNCTTQQDFTLTGPDKIQTNPEVSMANQGGYNLNCFGDQTGFVKLNATGGVPNYSYSWTDKQVNSGERSNLGAGNYFVTITDNLGCTLKDTISITQPGRLQIQSASLSDYNGFGVRCKGNDDGLLSVVPVGGTPDYTYNWTYNNIPLAIDSGNLTDRLAGNYAVMISDANNCRINWSGVLTEPVPLNLTVSSTNVNCTGSRPGTALALASGGNGPYQFNWSNGNKTPAIAGLNPGDYMITITDKNLCTITDTVTIQQNTVVNVNVEILKPVSCYGLSDGILRAEAYDGVPPYNFEWLNGGPSDSTYTGLSAGTFSIKVVDSEGCEGTRSFELVQPDKLAASFVTTEPACYNFSDGYVNLDAIGGNEPYYFKWNDTLVNGNIIEDLRKGAYTLTVVDNKNCEIDTTVFINQPDKLTISINTDATVYPFCPDWQNGVLAVNVIGGTRNYGYDWEYSTDEHDSVMMSLKEDWYKVRVSDAHNCIVDTSFRLKALHTNCLGVPTAFTPNSDHANDFWEIRYMTEDGSEVHFDMVYPQGEIKIYDRLGSLVYKCSGGCPEDWNGEDMHGKLLPVDTYYYIIDLNTGDHNQPIKGIVTIIR
jgi:gliding motility-associated-like protein